MHFLPTYLKHKYEVLQPFTYQTKMRVLLNNFIPMHNNSKAQTYTCPSNTTYIYLILTSSQTWQWFFFFILLVLNAQGTWNCWKGKQNHGSVGKATLELVSRGLKIVLFKIHLLTHSHTHMQWRSQVKFKGWAS